MYGTAEQPLFKAADIATLIEHTDVSTMLRTVDQDEKETNIVCTPGGNQKAWFLTEDGLYEVLMQSRKPIAKEFKRGVKAILKEIRTNGGYLATTAEDSPEMIMAKALKLADSKIKEQAARLEEAETTIALKDDAIACYSEQLEKQKPFAEYAQDVLQSRHGYTMTVISKDLGFTSIHKFTDWAKEHHILYRQGAEWVPTANWSGRGYFTTYTFRFFRKDGGVETRLQLLVTERGRAALHYTLRHNARPTAAILEGGAL